MKPIIKRILQVIACWAIYDQTRDFHHIPLSSLELNICQEIGSTIHIMLFYVLPIFLVYKAFRKIIAFAAAQPLPDSRLNTNHQPSLK